MSIQLINPNRFNVQPLQPSVLHSKAATKTFNSSTQSSAANTAEEADENKPATSSSDYMNSMKNSTKLYSARRVMNFNQDPNSSGSATPETGADESSYRPDDANDSPNPLPKDNPTGNPNTDEAVIITPEQEEEHLKELAQGSEVPEEVFLTPEDRETKEAHLVRENPNFSSIA